MAACAFCGNNALIRAGLCRFGLLVLSYVVPEKLTLYEAASAPESLFIILVGTLFVLPTIMAYTVLSYYVFRGKATDLRYD